MYPKFDDRDQEILTKRQALFTARKYPKVGDFIRFPNGTMKRIAHVWTDDNNRAEWIQPTAGNGDTSFYLGDGYMSFSGSLNSAIYAENFTETAETMQGSAWFFHHDFAQAHNGVYVKVNCRVWNCNKDEE